MLTRGLTKVTNNAPSYYCQIVGTSIILYYLLVDFFTVTAMRSLRGSSLFPKAIVLFAVVCLLFASFLRQPPMVIRAVVDATSVGVYWDAGCTSRVESVDWGNLQPGSQKQASVYIRNEGGASIYLILGTAGWQPSTASRFMSLDWNYSKQKISPGDVVPLMLKLSVSSSIRSVTTFTFNITISPADMLVTVNLDVTTNQEGYIVADISLNSAESLAGGLGGYELNLSATNDLLVVGASGGQAPFNGPPKVSRADGKIVVSSSISRAQGPQLNSLTVARLWLRLNSIMGVATTIKPFSMIVMDAPNGSVHNVAVRGGSLRFVRGDANNDRRISIADAMVIAQYLAGNRPASDLNLLNAASVKQDGQTGDKITIADAMVIAQRLAGLGDQGSGEIP